MECHGSNNQIAAGPDGNVWFTASTEAVGRITPSGAITRYPLLATRPIGLLGLRPQEICSGPDGNLYVVGWHVWRVSPEGKATPLFDWGIGSITSGPDGNLWITSEDTNRILK